MDPVTLALIMGGSGLAKSELIDTPAARQKALLEAEKTRYSPWTGKFGEDFQAPNSLGNALSYGVQGAALGQNLEKHDADMALKQAQTEALKKHPSMAMTPWGLGIDTSKLGA